MNKAENVTFIENKLDLLNHLKRTKEFPRDVALQRVVELLNELNTIKELKKEKGLINRICIDSVENWESINMIGYFINNHVKKNSCR